MTSALPVENKYEILSTSSIAHHVRRADPLGDVGGTSKFTF
jgi:hypothetical protein